MSYLFLWIKQNFDSKVRGTGSDSAVLFPEYVARAARHGIEESDILPRIEYLRFNSHHL